VKETGLLQARFVVGVSEGADSQATGVTRMDGVRPSAKKGMP
jgi:hypothetical protein